MSLINKMLQELDKRHAPQGGVAGAGHAGGLGQHVRSVTPRKVGSDFFWRVLAITMLFAVGWVAWVVWQMLPHPLVTEVVEQAARERAGAAKTATAQAAPTPQAALVSPAPTPAPAPTPVSTPAQQQAADPGRPDMLRLATELTTPILARRAKPSSSAPAAKKPVALASPPPSSGKIDRRMNVTSHEGAESEFRRAVGLVNQGRIAEGMDGFRSALKMDPEHQAARQTLVALLLEAKRVNEAATAAQEGLALNPANAGYAMLLARIMVERGDIPGALALLQKHAASGGANPDYHAFTAALYQRLNRHKEAIDEYRTALGLAPLAGVWWVGVGISYQAVAQPRDAFEAFSRAKAAGNLTPELVGFVDQRLKQLQ
jgi:MSHA biogenesis protein MshN